MKTKKIDQKVNKLLSKIRGMDRNKWTRNISLALLLIDVISIFVAGSNFLKLVKWAGKNQDRFIHDFLPSHVEHYLMLLSNSLIVSFLTTLMLLIILWDFMRKHTKENRR